MENRLYIAMEQKLDEPYINKYPLIGVYSQEECRHGISFL